MIKELVKRMMSSESTALLLEEAVIEVLKDNLETAVMSKRSSLVQAAQSVNVPGYVREDLDAASDNINALVTVLKYMSPSDQYEEIDRLACIHPDSSYTVELDEDEDGNLILPIPEEILEHLGVVEGDELACIQEGETLVLKRIDHD